ncbi:hypothetical protein J1N35_021969 [Gossypium stocksii]|uniref:Uncharacterized protein n=1 Tax=Gossypium stocksii TaxID=47602 RepID=A0A9D4A1T8_9ROSI|nr:hypothetical protein J1N35_021969 [Gossypium stocksii]
MKAKSFALNLMEKRSTMKEFLETPQYFDDNIDDVPIRAEKDDKRIKAMREKQSDAFQVKGQEEKVYMLNKAS